MIDQKPPKIENAPGLCWRPREGAWYAYWLARSDLVKRGWKPAVVPMHRGGALNEFEIARIQTECQQLQADMLIWGRGGAPEATTFDGTLKGLCNRYQRDEYSNFPKLQYMTRRQYLTLMNLLVAEHGSKMIAEFRGPVLIHIFEGWQTNRGLPMAKQMLRMLRTLFSFGFTILEDKECERLCNVMGKMKFKTAQKRTVWLVAEQVIAIRAHAHTTRYKSIALAQAIQFDCLLRQKDVIGEWMPASEPGLSLTSYHNKKWMKGIRWEEIDDALVLRHITSKRQKPLEVPLRLCPMVMEELAKIAGSDSVTRDMLPKVGPIVCMDTTGRPWHAMEYRQRWREIARAVGVPDHVFNMDSRAGGITEASDAGAPLEHIRHAATHSDIATTQGYSRGAANKTAEVLKLRAAHRGNGQKT